MNINYYLDAFSNTATKTPSVLLRAGDKLKFDSPSRPVNIN